MSISDRRPSWDKTWLEVAATVAKRSLCDRDKVGAVIVNSSNRIVATGYNGPPEGFNHANARCTTWCDRAKKGKNNATFISNELETFGHKGPLDPGYSDCPSLHAEQNALSVCDRSIREGGTIYVTSDICSQCAKLIANSGLKQVVVKVTRIAKHRNSEEWYYFLESCGLTVMIIEPVTR